ncbi:hypothetical protein BGZ57DRAFT_969034 [Hyaloscypha finlandica]|nr:hypothetical protein BGZ57DRAFT_969034 [Hyaloscypha finlandica]
MASPIRLGAGDIVTAAQLLRKGYQALKDQHGACDDYKHVTRELDSTVFAIEQLQHLPSLPEYIPYVNAIIAQAQQLLATASAAQKNVSRFEGTLGERGRKGFHRSVLSKTRWAMRFSPETKECLQRIEGQSSALKSLLAQLTASVSLSGLKVGQQNLAVGTTILESVKQDAERRQRKFDLTENFMAKAQVALEAIEKQNVAMLCSASSFGSGALLQEIHSPEPEPQPVQIPPAKNTRQQQHQCGSLAVSWSPSFVLGCASPIRQRANMPEKNTQQWPTLNGKALSESQIRLLLVFGVLFELFGGACVLSYQLILCTGLMLSPAISNIPPDNIVVRDALGRRYSLPTAVFSDWPVLTAMLCSQFKDCPGLLNVESGQFNMIDEDDPELPVGPGNWTAVVVRRKRFKMSVVLSQLQMSNQLCAKCGAAVRTMGASTSACPRCGLFYRSSRTYRKRIQAKYIRKEQKSFGNARFDFESSNQVDQLGAAQTWDSYLTALWFEKEIISTHSHLAGVLGDACQLPIPQISEQPPNKETHGSGQEINRENRMEEDLNQQNLEEESENEAPNYGPTPELEEESAAVRSRELEEIRHFISVCMKQDERLHDAALKGDVQSLKELTIGHFDVDRDPGAWGTPLVAAIMACSNEAVTFLLDAGANPLSQVGPMDSPVLAATLFGTSFALRAVLAKISQGRGSQTCSRRPWTRPCLQQSMKAAHIRRRRQKPCCNAELRENFLAQACGRDLLTDIETRYMAASLRRTPLPDLSDTWIDTCCLNLQIRRTEMVEKRVAVRLVGKASFSSLIPIWRNRSQPFTYADYFKPSYHPFRSPLDNAGNQVQMLNSLPEINVEFAHDTLTDRMTRAKN